MGVDNMMINGYETVVQTEDATTGLQAIIAVHDTTLGPAVGGTRIYPYASKEDALNDVLRLSRGMTYKSALAGINFGGGKSVIIADPSKKTPELLKAFGSFVNTLNGKYICAEDMNSTTADMAVIHEVTEHVAGLDTTGGDPSPITALGVFVSIKTTAEKKLGIPLNELTIAIQGVGHVGAYLVKHLTSEGAKVFVADVNQASLDAVSGEAGVEVVSTDDIMTVECDIFAPCAMGGILNEKTIPNLNCKAVVGAANNQLGTDEDATRLMERGILYAPDYLVNAGGIINVHFERMPGGYNAEEAKKATWAIGDTLMEIYAMSEKDGISPAVAADKLAEERIARKKGN
jgi:leucine dehydrogenase